jgi:hypothetical protein
MMHSLWAPEAGGTAAGVLIMAVRIADSQAAIRGLPRQVTGLALLIAGHRRAHLRDAWKSDLLNEDGTPVPMPRQMRHVAGYVVAAIRYRLVNDLGYVLGRLLDAILISRRRTRAMVVPISVSQVVMVFAHQGLYGLVTNVEQFAALGGILCAAVLGARAWRGVQPPKRAKREDHD